MLFFILLSLIILAAISEALIFQGHYKAFRIPNVSMEPTFHVNDRVIVDQRAYKDKAPQRGDIIVFKLTIMGKTKLWCKRIVGLPGEKLEIKEQKIFINDKPVSLPWFPNIPLEAQKGWGKQLESVPMKALIPEDNYYVLGDNLRHSFDSRHFDFVARRNIRGKVVMFYSGKMPIQKIVKLILTGKTN